MPAGDERDAKPTTQRGADSGANEHVRPTAKISAAQILELLPDAIPPDDDLSIPVAASPLRPARATQETAPLRPPGQPRPRVHDAPLRPELLRPEPVPEPAPRPSRTGDLLAIAIGVVVIVLALVFVIVRLR